MSTTLRWTLVEYDRMIEAGLFGGPRPRRAELIGGEIREMTPIGPAHEDAVTRLDDWSHDNAPSSEVLIRVQSSIGLPEIDSAPQPDVAWVVRGDYRDRRPTAAEVLLITEVAESSLASDRSEKAELYAAAGIAEYWLVDLTSRAVEVRRDPFRGRYRSLQTYTGDQELHPLCFPDIVLRPAMLF